MRSKALGKAALASASSAAVALKEAATLVWAALRGEMAAATGIASVLPTGFREAGWAECMSPAAAAAAAAAASASVGLAAARV